MKDTAARTADLRRLLNDRRREMQQDVEAGVRDNRADRPGAGRDTIDESDADFEGTLHLALLQMRSETVARIDEALVRLDAGEYGSCLECGDRIAEPRLRALPFAIRCQPCEDRRERERLANRRARLALSRAGQR